MTGTPLHPARPALCVVDGSGGSTADQFGHAARRLRPAADGLTRIGSGCRASQNRCGHHVAPDAAEVTAVLLAHAPYGYTSRQLVPLLLQWRGCTAVSSHGVRNALARLAQAYSGTVADACSTGATTGTDGCGGGLHTIVQAPGCPRLWWACAHTWPESARSAARPDEPQDPDCA